MMGRGRNGGREKRKEGWRRGNWRRKRRNEGRERRKRKSDWEGIWKKTRDKGGRQRQGWGERGSIDLKKEGKLAVMSSIVRETGDCGEGNDGGYGGECTVIVFLRERCHGGDCDDGGDAVVTDCDERNDCEGACDDD